jgi:hypothetical protein
MAELARKVGAKEVAPSGGVAVGSTLRPTVDELVPSTRPVGSDEKDSLNWWLREVSGPLCDRYPSMRRLRERLLTHGGRDVIYHPCHLLDAGRLLKRGRFIEAPKLTLKGMPRLCHYQAVGLYALGALERVCTGFALCPDTNLWLQHSFGMSRQGEIVETCEPQAAYFAATLTGQEIRQLQYMVLFGPVAGILL